MDDSADLLPLEGSYVDVPNLNRLPISSSTPTVVPLTAAGSPTQAPPTPIPSCPSQTTPTSAADLSTASINSSVDRYLRDQHSRVLLLRGVSLSGLSKLPSTPDGRTHVSERFFDHRNISFRGRPFPLDEADSHFARLKRWGLTLIRLVVCWEALEHSGPGEYDEEYLDYIVALIDKAQKWGFKVWVDAHQDVWSRLTGGSGAPGWTLELVGLNAEGFKDTGAAALHQLGAPIGVWPSGYQKLAAATMFTVFFGGNTFAYKRRVPRKVHKIWAVDTTPGFSDAEIGLQDFLQESLCEAFSKLAERLQRFDCVLGFEPMNEPHRGYLNLHSPFLWDYNTDLAIHHVPTFLESLALGSGHPQVVDVYRASWPFPTVKSHKYPITPQGMRAWLPGFDCLWREHGVWEWDESRDKATLLRAGYFEKCPRTGEKWEFYRDGYWPFVRRFGERMQKVKEDWAVPVGPIPNEFYPRWPKAEQPRNLISAPHFYDLHSLFSKAHGTMTVNVQGLSRGMPFWKALYFGRNAVKDNYALQIKNIVDSAYRNNGEAPCLIGEAGICMDMNSATAFRDGNFSWQLQQMDALIHALETNLVSFALWNYNPDNNAQYGDSWNGENFSIFSPAVHKALHGDQTGGDDKSGSIVHQALLRPYACKIAGVPVSTSFDMHTLMFRFSFTHPGGAAQAPEDLGSLSRVTEIFIPRERYPPEATRIAVNAGEARHDSELQTIFWTHEPGHEAGFVYHMTITADGVSPAPLDVFSYLHATSWGLVGVLICIVAIFIAL